MHTLTTLLAVLTGATVALADPVPAAHPALVTPAPVLHPVAARFLGKRQSDSSDDPDDSDLPEFTTRTTYDQRFTCIHLLNSFGLSLDSSLPRETGNKALASWLTSRAEALVSSLTAPATRTQTDDDAITSLCSASFSVTPPATLSSAFSSYQDRSRSWISSAAPVAHSIASECPGVISAQVELLIVSDGDSCTSAVLDYVHAYRAAQSDGRTSTGSHVSTETSSSSPSSSSGASGTSEPGESQTGAAGGGDGNGNGGSQQTSGTAGGAAQSSNTSTAGVPRETGWAGVAVAAAVAVAGVVAAL